uniref:HAD family phosphatase n=1 Tax=Globodera rostochiensis TaxID=31243 RepID=A0A914IDX4_GLORO
MVHQIIKAVLFDLGGVVMEYGNFNNYLNRLKIIQAHPELKKRFEQFECGLLTIHDIEPELLESVGIKNAEDLERVNPANSLKQKNAYIDGAIQSLRSSGKYLLGILTNNGYWVPDRSETTLGIDTSAFDFVIESCKIGKRKPNSDFYETALQKMGLSAGECVFIDDLEVNCKGAEDVGIRSIWLKNGDFKAATEQLEEILGEKIL